MKISIIIPILNEVDTIGTLLTHLTATIANPQHISEILVVDGGSTDGSQEVVTHYTTSSYTIQLVSSPKGRAKQMNTGATIAHGSILYFLHADSFPPKDFDLALIQTVTAGSQAGCFCMRFHSTHWWLRLAGWLTQFNYRACRGGDQSLFITTTLFATLQGFDESFIIYEDNDLIGKLYDQDEFTVIQKWLTTSARRYETHGIWKLQYHFWAIYVQKWFGASPSTLYQYYKKHIA